MIVINIRN